MRKKNKKIGFLTYSEEPTLTDSDKFIMDVLETMGYRVNPVIWDNHNVEWNTFDLLIFRSCWDYHLKIRDFYNWLSKIQKLKIRTFNSIDLVRWNLSKTYIKDLENRGIKIIPSVIISENKFDVRKITTQKGWGTFVVKPTIGASAYGVEKFDSKNLAKATAYIGKVLRHSDVIIQPFIPEITSGEVSLIFVGKEFSHAVNKIPKPGEYRSNYEFRESDNKIILDQKIIKQAEKVLDTINEDLLYARVDGVIKNGNLLIMELEVIDPYLFLNIEPSAAIRLANKIDEYVNIQSDL